MEEEDQLLLKWDDHHKSFFSLASELMDREELIDVTLLAGESSFPAHKLILSICSPYFRSLFVRNPCSHPMVVLKDVSPKYLRLLLVYMYEGQVACPSLELHGLLATAKSLQIRGLLELEKKRRRGSSSTDEQTTSSSSPGIILNNNNHILKEEDIKNEEEQPLDMQIHSNPEEHHPHSPPLGGGPNSQLDKGGHPYSSAFIKGNPAKCSSNGGSSSNNMLPPNSLDPSDPMASMNALLAAAASQQVQQQQSNNSSGSNNSENGGPASKLNSSAPSNPEQQQQQQTNNPPSNEMNQAAAMANLQLYYYMQKVAGMGGSSGGSPGAAPTSSNSPKERKECHVCGKTLYDRSTWNRHMRIHTGEKPYPCRFCGRRFRTNYNKLGHEKKCPDRHNREGGGGDERGAPAAAGNAAAPAPPPTTNSSSTPVSMSS